MNYLKIQNNGELDIRLVALMGGTTKANDKYKIGQFGTGLKYTLAFLYRNNLDFKIFVGETEVKIHLEHEEIRGEMFDIICINGRRTSITTRMGTEWKAWMIIRELWCNALDEGGAIKSVQSEDIGGTEGETTFYIQISSDIQDVISQWDKYFVPEGLTPVFKNSMYVLYPAGAHLCIYKHGVLIYENIAIKSVFRYDILFAQINELREYKSSPSCDISAAIKQLDAVGIEYFLQHLTTELYEGNNMDYNWYGAWGEGWKVFSTTTRMINESIRTRFSDGGYDYREQDYTILPNCIYNSLSKDSDGFGNETTSRNEFDFFIVENSELDEKVMDCMIKLSEIGYEINPKLNFSVGFFDDGAAVIKLDRNNKKLLIGLSASAKTMHELMALLVEENERFNSKISETLQLKNHFVGLYMKMLSQSASVEA